MPSRQEMSLQPFFIQAENMAHAWVDYENVRIENGETAWPIFNTNFVEMEEFFETVLQGRTLKTLARNIRNKHGHLIAINIGSNNNPLEEIQEAGDIFISVGLQELRTPEQIANDTQRNTYFIPGTVGTPELWEHRLPTLLSRLQAEGKIRDKYVNFLLENLGIGWDSLPINQKFIDEYEKSRLGDFSEQHFPKARKQAFANYFCWITAQSFQFIHPDGGIGLAAFPEEADQILERWYKKQGKQFDVEKNGYQILLQRHPTFPSVLT